MKCKNCGEWLPEGAGVCALCGTEAENYDEIMKDNINRFGMEKCEKCGYIGASVPEKMLNKKDWMIIILTFPIGYWIGYLLYVYFKKGDISKRNKVCPSCGNVMKYYIDERTMQEIFKDDDAANKAKTVITNVIKDPEVRKSFKDLKKSFKDLHDTF